VAAFGQGFKSIFISFLQHYHFCLGGVFVTFQTNFGRLSKIKHQLISTKEGKMVFLNLLSSSTLSKSQKLTFSRISGLLSPLLEARWQEGSFSAGKLRLVAASTIPQSGQPEEGKQFDTLQGEGNTIQHFNIQYNTFQQHKLSSQNTVFIDWHQN